MKKIIILLISLILLTSCINNKYNAKETISNYLNSYIKLEPNVIKNLNDFINEEDMTIEQKNIYSYILKRQYSSLNYEFIYEKYMENKAYITTKITVLDLLNVQNEASLYLKENPQVFLDENNNYDKNKFLNYKLDKMQKVTNTSEYEIEFILEKKDNKWVINPLSNEDLLKIHGIYE